jgi:hypothetical protein
MDMISPTTTRVAQHTAEDVNRRIREEIEGSVACRAAGGREAIDRRLAELDQEWNIERALELNAAVFSLLGLTLGATRNRGWFLFPAVVAGFLAQHAVQGWCPPVPVLRRLGFRTPSEIDQERYALKALRGDFQDLPVVEEGGTTDVQEVLARVCR